MIDVENNAFNTNHAVIKYYVARLWKLLNITGWALAEHIAGMHHVPGNQEKFNACFPTFIHKITDNHTVLR